MESDEVPQAQKKQVSERVLQNLAKAQAANRLKHEKNKAAREAEKEALKKQRRVEKLRKQLVELEPEPESEPEETSEPTVEDEMVQEVVVKKVKAPPPVEKVPVVKSNPKPVKERPIPPPRIEKSRVDYF